MGEFRYVGTPFLIARAQAAVHTAVGQAAEDLLGKAMGETPVDTGTLRASLHIDGPHGGGDYVFARVQTGGEANAYAIFVHEGTGAHLILPKQEGGFLHFGGQFARVVHHPGTQAYKFLERPLLLERETLLAFISAAARAAF
jgi:bacteriophage HK97-gp10 putative tail-component